MRTLRQIQKELKANWSTIVKLIDQLGIKVQRVGKIVLVSEEDFELIKEAHKKISKPKCRNLKCKESSETKHST